MLQHPLLDKHYAAGIEQFLSDAEALLDVSICVHDHAAVFHATDGQSLLLPRRRYHDNAYCELDRFAVRDWDRRCKAHCLVASNARAGQLAEPFRQTCWKGVGEVVIPILRDGVHLVTLFAGQFRDPAAAPDVPASVLRAWRALPGITPAGADRIGRVLGALGVGLLALIDQSNQLDTPGRDRATQIRRFLHYHAHRPDLRLADLAGAIDLSESRTSHLVRELFDTPFQDLLLRERLARAKAMLLSTRYTVRVIAARTGFGSEYYFSRIFRRQEGIPPGAFRRLHADRAAEVHDFPTSSLPPTPDERLGIPTQGGSRATHVSA